MTFEVRTSERRSFKRCLKRWQWGYKERLKANRESNPLWFGQAVHLALAEYYQPGFERGPHPASTFVSVLEDGKVSRFDPESEEDAAEYAAAVKMGVDMLTRYVEEYGAEPEWEIIAPEKTFHVFFRDPRDPENDRWMQYDGTWDGVARYVGESNETFTHGSIWLLEHKTAASIVTSHLPTDDQAGAYWAIAPFVLRKEGLLKEDERIEGILYNFLRKAEDDPRPRNAEGLYTNKPTKQNYLDQLQAAHEAGLCEMPTAKQTVDALAEMAKQAGVSVIGDPSKMQPAPYLERIPVFRSPEQSEMQLQRIVDEAQHLEHYRQDRPLLPIIKNFTKECAWDCEFYRMCVVHEAGGDWEEFRNTMFHVWDPYEAHDTKSA